MADSSKISFLLFLFTFLLSRQIHARESQFFNKIPSNNNNNNVAAAQNQPNHEDPLNKADQEPTFIPENENGGYGLYGHESGQLPPTTTTTAAANTNLPGGFLPKYLPKNYNTVAYVTQPEGYTQPKATSNNYYNAGNAYYRDQSQPQGYSASSSAADATSTNGDRYKYNPTNYNTDDRYNGEENQFKLDQKDNYNTNADNPNNYNSNVNSVEKQGMSDTRFMENGRYFYDINLEENNKRYPFENTRTFGEQYNRKNGGYYGSNNENSYEFNSLPNQGFEGFESQGEQFQDFQNQRALP